MVAAKFETVEEYLAALADDVREPLQLALDRSVRAVPEAQLTISYQMPTVTSGGRRIVHLAGWKSHLAIYPAPDAEALADELAPYLTGKGTLRFPLGEPIPYDLIERVAAALYAQQSPQ